jgi:hypothetical protein
VRSAIRDYSSFLRSFSIRLRTRPLSELSSLREDRSMSFVCFRADYRRELYEICSYRNSILRFIIARYFYSKWLGLRLRTFESFYFFILTTIYWVKFNIQTTHQSFLSVLRAKNIKSALLVPSSSKRYKTSLPCNCGFRFPDAPAYLESPNHQIPHSNYRWRLRCALTEGALVCEATVLFS